jgi:hypothetical protein
MSNRRKDWDIHSGLQELVEYHGHDGFNGPDELLDSIEIFWDLKTPRSWVCLAPRRGMLKMDQATYRVEYRQILDKLNPQKVFNDLGEDTILLCLEGRVTRPCRRHLTTPKQG